MAKSSRYQGPSITETEAADEENRGTRFPARVRRPELGYIDHPAEETEEPKSATTDGGDSQQSSKSVPNPADKPKPTPRKLAHTTGNHSKAQEPETDSDVTSTVGGGRSKTTRPFDSHSTKPNSRTVDEFDEFA